jgi:hypothetical protein
VKAIAIEVAANRATVVLTPGWLGRLFGARETVVDLEWHDQGWRAVASRTRLWDLAHRRLITRALDFRPRAYVPRAIARRQ